jgi:hypothetical protein
MTFLNMYFAFLLLVISISSHSNELPLDTLENGEVFHVKDFKKCKIKDFSGAYSWIFTDDQEEKLFISRYKKTKGFNLKIFNKDSVDKMRRYFNLKANDGLFRNDKIVAKCSGNKMLVIEKINSKSLKKSEWKVFKKYR